MTRPTKVLTCLNLSCQNWHYDQIGLFLVSEHPFPSWTYFKTLFCQVLYNQAFSFFSTIFIQLQMMFYLHINKSILKTLSNEITETTSVPDDQLIHAVTGPPIIFPTTFVLGWVFSCVTLPLSHEH